MPDQQMANFDRKIDRVWLYANNSPFNTIVFFLQLSVRLASAKKEHLQNYSPKGRKIQLLSASILF